MICEHTHCLPYQGPRVKALILQVSDQVWQSYLASVHCLKRLEMDRSCFGLHHIPITYFSVFYYVLSGFPSLTAVLCLELDIF